MKYEILGRTGVSVSRLCLGTMMLGRWGNPDEADSARIVRRALDHGINFIDTADVYSGGQSEEFVGRALHGVRDDVFLSTKFFLPMAEGRNRRGGSRSWIFRAIEDSLRRLGTEFIDLYQVHRPSSDTDVEETLSALTDLVRQGKVRYIGSSSYSGSQIVEAQWVASDRRLERFKTEQPPYSLLVRGVEADVLPTAHRHGMGVLTYSPLAGGWLSGRWRGGAAAIPTSRDRVAARFDMADPANHRKPDLVEQLYQVAHEAGLSLLELALAFTLRHPAVTSAILGPRTVEQLEGQLRAVDVELGSDVLDRIDEIVPPGVTINPADNSYAEAELAPGMRRRVE